MLRVLRLIVTDVDGRERAIATLLASVCLSCTYAFKYCTNDLYLQQNVEHGSLIVVDTTYTNLINL